MQRFDEFAHGCAGFGWFFWISPTFGRGSSAPAWSRSLRD